MKKLFILYVLICFSFIACSNEKSIDQFRNYDSVTFVPKIDSLRLACATNKTILAKYELACLIALSNYPELQDVEIEFREENIETTMNARPTVVSTIFKSKTNRKYIIRINSQQLDSVISLSTVPFNAKIGVIAHELAHIEDYCSRNFFRVVYRLLQYTTQHRKEAFEKEIDEIAINHGLGWQLYDWSYYVLNESNATVEYKEFKEQTYLTPEEIKKIIEN